MKKKLLLISFIFLFLCSCSNDNTEDKYANFKHYSSSDFDQILHNHGYMIGVLPPNDMETRELLLYQIGKDDYIFLTEISGFKESPNLDKSSTYFYKDKLFVLRYVPRVIIEYSLEEEKTKSGETIYYKYDNSIIEVSSIEKVENNSIYFIGSANEKIKNVKFKCSLENRVCEIDN